LQDTIYNAGFRTEEHMMLYHFNLGYPLMDEHAIINIPSNKVVARDSGVSPASADRFESPQSEIEEEVFFRDTAAGSDGKVSVGVWNPRLRHPGGEGLGLTLSYSKSELPWLTQWKMPGEGTYVLGLEPCNTLVSQGPAHLEPGETKTYGLTVSVDIGGTE
jgi:hypothetical protein